MTKQEWINAVNAKDYVVIDTTGGYTYDQVMSSRNTSKSPDYWFRIANKDKYLFRSTVAESWEFLLPKEPNPIANMNQVYLRFIDSSVFSVEARRYKRSGKYSNSLPGTVPYDNYWHEQTKFCLYGRTVDGVRVSGRYYFMLNFTRMNARVKNLDGTWGKDKYETFPSFLDHQYYLMNEVEWWFLDSMYSMKRLFQLWFPEATDDDYEALVKQSGAIPKARRKGLTYVAANGVNTYNYYFVPSSYSLIAAYRKDLTDTLLDEGIHATINWLNAKTAWVRLSEMVPKQHDNFMAAIKVVNNGVVEVRGLKSVIKAITTGNSAFSGVGKSAYSVSLEEAGTFDNLISTYAISVQPLIRDGAIQTGTALIWGTAGDMSDGGGSQGLYEMAYNPSGFNMCAYENIYDEGATGESSLFIDNLWYYPIPPAYKKRIKRLVTRPEHLAFLAKMGNLTDAFDNQGNSIRFLAKLIQEDEREMSKRSGTKAYMLYITQNPIYLSEAFLVSNTSPFDIGTAKEALAELIASNYKPEYGYFAHTSEGGIVWRADSTKYPIMEFPHKDDEMAGCWVIYKKPTDRTTARRYIAGTDPNSKGYEESNDKNNMHSLASTFIMDSFTGELMAEYSGRTARADEYFKELLRGLEYYGATTMYESNFNSLFKLASSLRKLPLLANEPTLLKGKVGYKMGKVGTKGVHIANKALKDEFLGWVADWLDEEVLLEQDEVSGENTYVKRYFTIKCVPLLQELIKWKPKGNFDRVSALIMLMIYYHEVNSTRGKKETTTDTKRITLGQMFENRFGR